MLQLTPSRLALSFADKAVFLFHQPAMFAQPMIGAAELGVSLFYIVSDGIHLERTFYTAALLQARFPNGTSSQIISEL